VTTPLAAVCLARNVSREYLILYIYGKNSHYAEAAVILAFGPIFICKKHLVSIDNKEEQQIVSDVFVLKRGR